MAKDTVKVVRVFSTERLNNSVNGNPRYKFYTNDGVYTLMSDSGDGYKVNNYKWDSVYGTDVSFTLTPAGRVRGFTVFVKNMNDLNTHLLV